MSGQTIFALQMTGLLITVALAVWKGQRPTAFGGVWILLGAIPQPLLQLWYGRDGLPYLLVDCIYAFGFLALALRFASAWLIVALVAQGIQFATHSYYIIAERPLDVTSAIVNNSMTGVTQLALIVALVGDQVSAARRRRDQLRSPPSRAAGLENQTP